MYNTQISILLAFCGSVGVTYFTHKIKDKKKSLQVHFLNLSFIFIELLIGYYFPPNLKQLLLSTPPSGGGTYFLKAGVMFIPLFIALKCVTFKDFGKELSST